MNAAYKQAFTDVMVVFVRQSFELLDTRCK